MTAKVMVHPLFVILSSLTEILLKPFRRPEPPVLPVETPSEIFENNARETVREIEEHKPTPEPPRNESEIVTPHGICLHKSIHFRTREGGLLAAKVMGYSWEDDGHFLVLSRNGGPLFRRRLC